MSKYPDFSEVKFGPGMLLSYYFDYYNQRISKGFYFRIRLAVGPVEWNGKSEKTVLEMDLIEVELNESWKEIEGKEYSFPLRPKEGHIESSLMLNGKELFFDVKRIKFGEFDGGRVNAEIDVICKSRLGSKEEVGKKELKLNTDLFLDESKLDEDFNQRPA